MLLASLQMQLYDSISTCVLVSLSSEIESEFYFVNSIIELLYTSLVSFPTLRIYEPHGPRPLFGVKLFTNKDSSEEVCILIYPLIKYYGIYSGT